MENKITYLKTILRTKENGNYLLGVQTFVGKFEAKTPNAEDEITVEVISKEQYDNLLVFFNSAPQAPEGFGYQPKDDLTWELYLLPIVEENEEIIE